MVNITKPLNDELINNFEKSVIGSRSRAPCLNKGATIKASCFKTVSMAACVPLPELSNEHLFVPSLVRN